MYALLTRLAMTLYPDGQEKEREDENGEDEEDEPREERMHGRVHTAGGRS